MTTENKPKQARSYIKHGMHRSKEYGVWIKMKERCSNSNSPDYPYYGGRGIKVCDEWNTDFRNFLRDMGKRPAWANCLDRINPYGNYEPGNVQWATWKMAAQNTRRQYIKKLGKQGCSSGDGYRLIKMPDDAPMLTMLIEKKSSFELNML